MTLARRRAGPVDLERNPRTQQGPIAPPASKRDQPPEAHSMNLTQQHSTDSPTVTESFLWTGEDAGGVDLAIRPSRELRGSEHVAHVRQAGAGAFWSVLGSPECGPMDFDQARIEASAALVELGFEPPAKVLVYRTDSWAHVPLVLPSNTFTCECVEVDGSEPTRASYTVTSHEGARSRVRYCTDCAELAAVDWNGETKAIERDGFSFYLLIPADQWPMAGAFGLDEADARRRALETTRADAVAHAQDVDGWMRCETERIKAAQVVRLHADDDEAAVRLLARWLDETLAEAAESWFAMFPTHDRSVVDALVGRAHGGCKVASGGAR